MKNNYYKKIKLLIKQNEIYLKNKKNVEQSFVNKNVKLKKK